MPATKLACVKTAKSKFKAIVSRMQASLPNEFVPRLPMSVAEYMHQHKEWYEFAFPNSVPVPTRITTVELYEVMSSTPMRSSRADASTSSHAHQQQQLQHAQASDMQGLFQHMVMAFAQRGTQQQQQQQQQQQERPCNIQYAELPRSASENRMHARLQSKLMLLDTAPKMALQAPLFDQQPVQQEDEQQPPKPQEAEEALHNEQPEQQSKMPRRALSVLDAAAAVAAAMETRKADNKRKASEQTNAPAAKAKAKAKGKAKAATPVVAKPKASKTMDKAKACKSKDKAQGKGSWTYERTRDQVLARTGRSGPGQTKTFRGMGADSVKAAKKWLKDNA